MSGQRNAFTIVELLIVIVVIAILAAITVVAYNGIQDRAASSSARSVISNSIKKIELFKVDSGSPPVSITDCPTPSLANLCLNTDPSTSYLYRTSTGPSRPAYEIASINNRRFMYSSSGEVYSTNEFVKYADLAPLIDQFGIRPYTVEFDLKSADSSVDNTTTLYMQNGSGSRYTFTNQTLTVSDSYAHYKADFTPALANASLTESWIAFFGSYSTGNKPIISNLKFYIKE